MNKIKMTICESSLIISSKEFSKLTKGLQDYIVASVEEHDLSIKFNKTEQAEWVEISGHPTFLFHFMFDITADTDLVLV